LPNKKLILMNGRFGWMNGGNDFGNFHILMLLRKGVSRSLSSSSMKQKTLFNFSTN
jgi:hypothetical protein